MKNYAEVLKQLREKIPGHEEHLGKRILFWILAIGISIALFGTIVLAAFIGIISITLPDVSDLEDLAGAQSTEIFDREENLLYTIHGEENREYVPLKDITKNLVDATVSIEDGSFWEHSGFDIPGITKAVLYELFGVGTPRGGSTITQQYIKNTFLSSERSYIRKLKELILSLRLEGEFEKEKIIELYLNRIPYGNNAYGIQKASEIYFNKSAKDLTLGESAILASLPQAPSRYNPFGNNKYSHLLKEFSAEELFLRKVKAEADLKTEEYIRGCIGQYVTLVDGTKFYIQGRSDLVLARMESLGYITNEQRRSAVTEIHSITFNNYRTTIKHPHFVLHVKQMVEDKYGKDIVETGGLKVYTTLDPELQKYAEEMASSRGTSNASSYGANNAAVLTIDAKTGEILAMVGSRDYYNEEIHGNVNVVTRARQPGSSFKPIVYAQAFYNSYSPSSVIYDVPTKFGSDQPQNFDGKFSGQMSIRKALGLSRNIPAIKAYFLAGGQDAIIDLATKMGITTLKKSHSYGYPLALGAGEIPLMEMVSAFAVFANNGQKPEIVSILKIENANGDVIEKYEPKTKEEVLDPQIAFLINSILSDESVKIGGNLRIDGYTVAGKTGTSTKANKKESGGKVYPSDGWVIGYTPSIVTGVWIGNTDGTGMYLNANGHDAAGPIFKAVMTRALRGKQDEKFEEPKGIKKVAVSITSGLLPGPSTPPQFIKEELFASFSVPTEIDNSFQQVQIDSISGKLATAYTPKEAIKNVLFIKHSPIAPYENWAVAINDWYTNNPDKAVPEEFMGMLGDLNVSFGIAPTEEDDIHTAETMESKPEIRITSPVTNSKIAKNTFFKVEIDYSCPNGIDRVEYFIDDELKFSTSNPPYNGSIRIPKYFATGGKHLVSVKIIDRLGYSAESVIEIKAENENYNESEN